MQTSSSPQPMSPTNPLTVRIPPLIVMTMAGLLAWVIAQSLADLNLDSPARVWLAPTLGFLGLMCSALGVASFRRARTTVNPMKPEATTALVISGIYRVTRNPMYLGFLFCLLSELAWLANPAALLVAPAFVLYLDRFQIRPEEQALLERFGPKFSTYSARVPRWI